MPNGDTVKPEKAPEPWWREEANAHFSAGVPIDSDLREVSPVDPISLDRVDPAYARIVDMFTQEVVAGRYESFSFFNQVALNDPSWQARNDADHAAGKQY